MMTMTIIQPAFLKEQPQTFIDRFMHSTTSLVHIHFHNLFSVLLCTPCKLILSMLDVSIVVGVFNLERVFFFLLLINVAIFFSPACMLNGVVNRNR